MSSHALTDTNRSQLRLLKTAIEMRENTAPNDLFFSHAVLTQVGLPYRNPGDAIRHWDRKNGRVELRLEAGSIHTPAGWRNIGLPFGARARLVMIHVSSQAVLNQSPTIELSDSLTALAADLGLSTNGYNIRTLREQMTRLSATTMMLADSSLEMPQVQTKLFSKLKVWCPDSPRQRVLWPSTVTLSAEFYASLIERAVPLDPRALGALKHSARALDVYTWLAHRLMRVQGGYASVSWKQLRSQFGHSSQAMRSFKPRFVKALEQVLLVYRAANVEVDPANGLLLRRSAPPSTGHRRITQKR